MKNQVVTPNPTVVYSSMWTKLKAHVGDYAPQTLVTDMEVASGSSMRDMFGEAVHVQYCYFHLTKCLREHIGEVHALAELSEPAFYNLYRMVISLPFIPAGDLVQVRVSQGPWVSQVVEGVLEPAMESAEGSISAAAMGFLNYFVDTYVAEGGQEEAGRPEEGHGQVLRVRGARGGVRVPQAHQCHPVLK